MHLYNIERSVVSIEMRLSIMSICSLFQFCILIFVISPALYFRIPFLICLLSLRIVISLPICYFFVHILFIVFLTLFLKTISLTFTAFSYLTITIFLRLIWCVSLVRILKQKFINVWFIMAVIFWKSKGVFSLYGKVFTNHLIPRFVRSIS